MFIVEKIMNGGYCDSCECNHPEFKSIASFNSLKDAMECAAKNGFLIESHLTVNSCHNAPKDAVQIRGIKPDFEAAFIEAGFDKTDAYYMALDIEDMCFEPYPDTLKDFFKEDWEEKVRETFDWEHPSQNVNYLLDNDMTIEKVIGALKTVMPE